jgi:protein-S-isoprenylcysteine O-methyltransferase
MLKVLLWAIVMLFPVSEIALGVFKRANPRVAEVEDRGSLGALWLAILAGVAMAIAAEWVRWARLPDSTFLQALALGLMIAGLMVRWTSILTLGRLFTVDVAIQAGHSIVETGLYRHVRHPSYAGLLLAFLGLGVFYASWLSVVVLMLPVTLAVLNRIAKEERTLVRVLGPAYGAYRARTWRLVPGVY